MKFKLDENVPLRLKPLISQEGHSVSDVYEERLQGKDDRALFETCRREELILITNDTDFENVQAYPLGTHAGIIVLRLKSQGAKTVMKAWQEFVTKVDLNKIAKAIIIIGPDLIKMRK